MAKSTRVRGRGEAQRGDGVDFPLSLQSVTPWCADWEQHAECFVEYLRDARFGSTVLIAGAVAGVAALLEAHWTYVEGVPPEEAMGRARQWKLHVMGHAIKTANAELVTPMELRT